MGTFFQVKRVIKKIYGRRKLMANIWKLSSGKPMVILKISNPNTNIRTVQNLIFYLEPNYFVAIRSNQSSFWLKFFTYLVPFKSVTINPLVSASNAFMQLDTNLHNAGRKKMPVRLIDQPKNLPEINVPYFKHPGFCWPENKQPKEISDDRNGWIFFAGNVNEVLYDHPNFESKYGVPNRYHVYKLLVDSGRTIINGYFNNDDISAQKKIYIHTLAANSLPQEKYIQYLQQFNCIVCAPGVTMPLCHNIIEAMEYGCIPVFSYPNWLPAGLVDGENCFIYKSLQELHELLNKLLLLTDNDFKLMRQKLVAYYQHNFIDFSLDLGKLNEVVVLNENKQMLYPA